MQWSFTKSQNPVFLVRLISAFTIQGLIGLGNYLATVINLNVIAIIQSPKVGIKLKHFSNLPHIVKQNVSAHKTQENIYLFSWKIGFESLFKKKKAVLSIISMQIKHCKMGGGLFILFCLHHLCCTMSIDQQKVDEIHKCHNTKVDHRRPAPVLYSQGLIMGYW